VRLAVLGAGAVGRAVASLAPDAGHEVVALADSRGAVVADSGESIDVDAALSRKQSGDAVGEDSVEAALNADYDALVEATPTTLGDAEPGFSHVRAALERDRHVVLANKGPVAERYGDLRALERESAGAVRFEATVAGAIPAVATVDDQGPANVESVRGVLNGTANFILSRMDSAEVSYDHALAEAQDLGIAEADPAFDVNGTDAALKCVILANVLREARGRDPLTLEDADVFGIQELPQSALKLAGSDEQTVRLVGEATPDGVRVAPRLLSRGSQFAVEGTRNVVSVQTTYAGSLGLAGAGAGGRETASAILADLGRLS
jgi:homoserine dehydrogenase